MIPVAVIALALSLASSMPALDIVGLVHAQAPPLPRPSPFPGSTPSRPSGRTSGVPATPAAPAPAPAVPVAVEPPAGRQAPEGTPVYPSAEFIDSYDAGSGQRYYLYGSNASYADVVSYYKNLLRNGGRELYEAPAMRQFDLGKYDEESMAYPPSVVVKDYTWNGSAGYLAAMGTAGKRFRTVIQIVPSTLAR
jgi:hypothetical protein